MNGATSTATAKGDVEVVEPTRGEQAQARRVAESRATVPDVTVGLRADAEAIVERLVPDGPTIADVLLRAAALALRASPEINAAYRDARFERFSRVNVGLAIEAGGALVIPTVFDADAKALDAIAAEVRELAAGDLTAPQLAGQTFTVWQDATADRLVPALVSPQAANLGAGGLRERIVAHDGAPAIRHVLDLTLVADGRILRPAQASAFLARIAAHLVDPAAL